MDQSPGPGPGPPDTKKSLKRPSSPISNSVSCPNFSDISANTCIQPRKLARKNSPPSSPNISIGAIGVCEHSPISGPSSVSIPASNGTLIEQNQFSDADLPVVDFDLNLVEDSDVEDDMDSSQIDKDESEIIDLDGEEADESLPPPVGFQDDPELFDDLPKPMDIQPEISSIESEQEVSPSEQKEYEIKPIQMIKHNFPKNIDNREPLPAGWVYVRHKSSMYLYLHRETKVVTWSRPYFLGNANAKTHHVPIASIPCLFQAKIKEKNRKLEELLQEDDVDKQMPVVDSATGNESINPTELKEYCGKNLFDTHTVNVKMYKEWLPREMHKRRLTMNRKLVREEKKRLDKSIKRIQREIVSLQMGLNDGLNDDLEQAQSEHEGEKTLIIAQKHAEIEEIKEKLENLKQGADVKDMKLLRENSQKREGDEPRVTTEHLFTYQRKAQSQINLLEDHKPSLLGQGPTSMLLPAVQTLDMSTDVEVVKEPLLTLTDDQQKQNQLQSQDETQTSYQEENFKQEVGGPSYDNDFGNPTPTEEIENYECPLGGFGSRLASYDIEHDHNDDRENFISDMDIDRSQEDFIYRSDGELSDSNESGEILSETESQKEERIERERQLEIQRQELEERIKKKRERKERKEKERSKSGSHGGNSLSTERESNSQELTHPSQESIDKTRQRLPDSKNDQGNSQPLPTLNNTILKVQYKDRQTGKIQTWTSQSNRAPQAILHDYCLKIYKTQATFIEESNNDDKQPWKITVQMPNGKLYGTGVGIKKKFAKEAATIETIEKLVPEYREKRMILNTENASKYSNDFFNHLAIDDIKAHNYLTQAGHILPINLLEKVLTKQNSLSSGRTAIVPEFQTVLPKKEYFDKNSTHLPVQKKYTSRKLDYTMTVGKHTVTGKADNIKIARNLAASQILKLMHQKCQEKVNTWGDLLRLYSSKQHAECQAQAENHEMEILERKGINKVTHKREPNYELLTKLRGLMEEIHSKRQNEKNLRLEQDRKEKEREERIRLKNKGNPNNLHVDHKRSRDHSGSPAKEKCIGFPGLARCTIHDHRPSSLPGETVVSSLPILDV